LDGNDYLFIDGIYSGTNTQGALGVPGTADKQTIYGGNVNWNQGTIGRVVQGWVKPTNGTAVGQQDVFWDSSQFGVFITAPSEGGYFWGLNHGDPGGDAGTGAQAQRYVTETAVTFNQWHHVFFRSQSAGGDGVLYINGIVVGRETTNWDATPEDPATNANNNYNQVLGANVTKTGNFLTGELDDWKFQVNGNNTTQGTTPPGSGRDFGAIVIQQDNDFIAQAIAGKNIGDVNLSGGVPDATDIAVFKANWRRVKSVGEQAFNPGGDLETRMWGDLDWNNTVDLNDAFILRAALIAGGSGATLDMSDLVPEPTSVLLAVFGALSIVGIRRRRS
jgi:hypothetical protein